MVFLLESWKRITNIVCCILFHFFFHLGEGGIFFLIIVYSIDFECSSDVVAFVKIFLDGVGGVTGKSEEETQ